MFSHRRRYSDTFRRNQSHWIHGDCYSRGQLVLVRYAGAVAKDKLRPKALVNFVAIVKGISRGRVGIFLCHVLYTSAPRVRTSEAALEETFNKRVLESWLLAWERHPLSAADVSKRGPKPQEHLYKGTSPCAQFSAVGRLIHSRAQLAKNLL